MAQTFTRRPFLRDAYEFSNEEEKLVSELSYGTILNYFRKNFDGKIFRVYLETNRKGSIRYYKLSKLSNSQILKNIKKTGLFRFVARAIPGVHPNIVMHHSAIKYSFLPVNDDEIMTMDLHANSNIDIVSTLLARDDISDSLRLWLEMEAI